MKIYWKGTVNFLEYWKKNSLKFIFEVKLSFGKKNWLASNMLEFILNGFGIEWVIISFIWMIGGAISKKKKNVKSNWSDISNKVGV